MNDYVFYAAQLRFAASKTERNDDDLDAMMNTLEDIASQIERDGAFRLEAENLRVGARGLAGIAGFLQQHILPEVIAAKNKIGEQQVRWTIDTSMSLMATIMTHAEMTHDQDGLELTLPSPPCDVC